MPEGTTSTISVTADRHAAGSFLLVGFAAALFASAFLLFSVQPVVSRLVLPRLGGSPGVWNTCVCFFQAALLLGYGYAHLSASRLRPRTQVALHALVMAAGLALMPLSLGVEAAPPDRSPVLWLLALLALKVGPPFVSIAATAPLLQAWFARTTHPQAGDPYFLYAASNAGSLLALLSYPVLIETTLGLSEQAWLWSIGFAATAAAVLACGVAALMRGATPAFVRPVSEAQPARVGIAERLRWLALAFVPSALMLAVTTHVTSDVAAVPLFWMVPLAIYILTFVIAFARGRNDGRRILLPLEGAALAAAAVTALTGTPNMMSMLVPLIAFTLVAAVCHVELARRRPDVRHLTSYFLLISIGGSLGGVFNALLAPVLFPVPLEYPVLLVAACLLRPPPAPLSSRAREDWASRGDLILPVALAASVLALFSAASSGPEGLRPAIRIGTFVLAGAALLWFARRRVRLALAVAACFLIPTMAALFQTEVTARSFFGVHRVVQRPQEQLVLLGNGTTIHGVQGTRPGEELVPYGYYHRGGPFGRFFDAVARRPRPVADVGVVGLGVGSLGCYARSGQTWTFLEIDPEVERLARDARWFRFLAGCGNRPRVVLGDARISLAADTAARYDVLIIDAFASDSIPIHLLTREALALYLSRLKPGGIVLFHVSNRYLDLVPVVARLAAEAGAPVRYLRVGSGDDGLRQTGAEVVAVATPGEDLEILAADGWRVPQPAPVLWTDDRSDILGVIRWN